METQKFYASTWFTILMLIIFFPVGLILMWKYGKFNKVVRIVITALLCLGLLFALFGEEKSDFESTKSSSTTEKKLTAAEKFAKDQKLSSKRGINFYNSLKSIGIEPSKIDVQKKAENGMSFDYSTRSEYTLIFKWNGDTDIEPELISFVFDGDKIL